MATGEQGPFLEQKASREWESFYLFPGQCLVGWKHRVCQKDDRKCAAQADLWTLVFIWQFFKPFEAIKGAGVGGGDGGGVILDWNFHDDNGLFLLSTLCWLWVLAK